MPLASREKKEQEEELETFSPAIHKLHLFQKSGLHPGIEVGRSRGKWCAGIEDITTV